MAKDILIDIGGTDDLIIANGDFKIGLSDEQHAVLLINTSLGAWKQFPLAGVGVVQYSASSGQSSLLRRNIVDQMKADGFSNIEVKLSGNEYDAYDYFISANRTD